VPRTSLGAPICQGARRITVEQSGKNIIFFGNAAGASGNHSYYWSFNNISNSCIQFVFSSMYQCIYIATHLHTIYLDWLQAVLESNLWCTWKWPLSELRDTHPGRDQASLEMHMEKVIKHIRRYTARECSSEIRNALRDRVRASLEMHLASAKCILVCGSLQECLRECGV